LKRNVELAFVFVLKIYQFVKIAGSVGRRAVEEGGSATAARKKEAIVLRSKQLPVCIVLVRNRIRAAGVCGENSMSKTQLDDEKKWPNVKLTLNLCLHNFVR
jgi:hypothetical protein